MISGVEIARGHESDRIAAVANELRRLGADVEEAPDGLVVHGARPCTAAGSIPTKTIASLWPLPPSGPSCRVSSSPTRAVLPRRTRASSAT